MAADQWNPDRYSREYGFVPRHGESLIEWLATRSGERILDLGCGNGVLTAKLVALGCDVAESMRVFSRSLRRQRQG